MFAIEWEQFDYSSWTLCSRKWSIHGKSDKSEVRLSPVLRWLVPWRLTRLTKKPPLILDTISIYSKPKAILRLSYTPSYSQTLIELKAWTVDNLSFPHNYLSKRSDDQTFRRIWIEKDLPITNFAMARSCFNIAIAVLAIQARTLAWSYARSGIFYIEVFPFLYSIITGSEGSLEDARIATNTKMIVEML